MQGAVPKVGRVDTPQLFTYTFPVNERSPLRFAIRGVKVKSLEFVIDNSLMSRVEPEYSESWTPETITPVDFFGAAYFNNLVTRQKTQVIVKTTSEGMPSFMIGFVEQETPTTPHEQKVQVFGEENFLVYADGMCALKFSS